MTGDDHAVVQICAPSRLHFGLLRFGTGHARQFGGAGVMLRSPYLRVRVQPADRLTVVGHAHTRVLDCVQRWSKARHRDAVPNCLIEVLGDYCPHAGLGSGTQLALAVGVGLELIGGRQPDLMELATVLDRGGRSAVGTYGFIHGGFIAELGREAHQSISSLHTRIEMPEGWRAVLIRARRSSGLAGEAETAAFARLPPVPPPLAERQERELLDCMIPALKRRDFVTFAQSVHDYGRVAGSCFSSCQGGPFASPAIQELVETCRQLGSIGAGQSSWGPNVFVLAESDEAARNLQQQLLRRYPADAWAMRTVGFQNHGAFVQLGRTLLDPTSGTFSCRDVVGRDGPCG